MNSYSRRKHYKRKNILPDSKNAKFRHYCRIIIGVWLTIMLYFFISSTFVNKSVPSQRAREHKLQQKSDNLLNRGNLASVKEMTRIHLQQNNENNANNANNENNENSFGIDPLNINPIPENQDYNENDDQIPKMTRDTNELDLDYLVELRLTPPKPCTNNNKKNSNKNSDQLDAYNDHSELLETLSSISGIKNYVPFVNRCNLQSNGVLGNMEIYEMWLNNKLGYMHNYKTGGTTIQNALELLVSSGIIPVDSKMPYFTNFANPRQRPHRMHLYHINQYVKKLPHLTHENLYNSLDLSFLFSYVRDPIDKMLSGFNEMHVRHSKILNKVGGGRQGQKHEQQSGIENFHEFLQLLLQIKNEKLIYNKTEILYKLENNREELATIYDILPDHHIHPQMYFLSNLEKEYFPFNFIGDMKDIEISLYEIIHYYYNQVNKNDYDKKYYNLKTRKHTDKYYLRRNQLSDKDIEMICQLSWMDYICIPFELPPQCDIKKLLKQHYGVHVTYDQCYHTTEEKFNN